MIYINLFGRCGNQLFAYAFARKLQEEYSGETLVFNSSFVDEKSKNNLNGNFWEISLNRFCVKPYTLISSEKASIWKYGSIGQKIMYTIWYIIYKIIKYDYSSTWNQKIHRKLFTVMSKSGLYYLKHGYSPYFLTKNKNKFVQGAFENIRWFDDIREMLLKELTPINPVSSTNKELYKKITVKNSICISLRNWSIDVHKKRGLEERNICNIEYYKKAIKIMCEKIDSPIFVVFSDDIEWAKNIMEKLVGGGIEILFETGKDDVAEKLRLMYSCKHFILSNSTFCWWAQYLCRNSKKIVISPDRWLERKGMEKHLIQKDWILVRSENGNTENCEI